MKLLSTGDNSSYLLGDFMKLPKSQEIIEDIQMFQMVQLCR